MSGAHRASVDHAVNIHIAGILADSERLGNGNPGSAPYNLYKCKDGMIMIATANNSLFTRLINVMGQPELIEDPRFATNPERKLHEHDIDPIVEAWTMQHDAAEIEKMLDAVGVPVAQIKTVEELIDDPQLNQRDMLVEHDIPGVGKVKYPGNPLKLQKTPPVTNRRAPLLGEDSEQILKDILHCSDEQIVELREEGIV